MSVGNINVDELLKRIRKSLKDDTAISEGLRTSIELMMVVISLLANRLGLNSKNSSKPPSSDPNRVQKKRENSGRKPGGQNGRKGTTLSPVEDPDEVEEIFVDRSKLPAGKYKTVGHEARQVFDIDISVIVTEFRAEILEDESGNKVVAEFPAWVNSRVQYGNGVRAHSVYLSQYQLLPCNRVAECFGV